MKKHELVKIINEIGRWSEENFGDQSGDGLTLGRIAPLLGVIEEGREVLEATSVTDLIDGIADMLIFLSDYVTRSGFPAEELAEFILSRDHTRPVTFSAVVGRLCAAELKRVQGIRSGRDDEWYRDQQRTAIREIVAWCYSMLPLGDNKLAEHFVNVWSEVKKRNWKQFPSDGRSL